MIKRKRAAVTTKCQSVGCQVCAPHRRKSATTHFLLRPPLLKPESSSKNLTIASERYREANR